MTTRRGLNCGSTNTSPNIPSHTSSRNSAVLWSFCCRSCTDEVSVLKGAAGNAGGGFYAEFPRDALRVNEGYDNEAAHVPNNIPFFRNIVSPSKDFLDGSIVAARI